MPKSIKLQRVESVLRELVPEAISTLSNEAINNIPVIDVECSRGKYDANVYLDPHSSIRKRKPVSSVSCKKRAVISRTTANRPRAGTAVPNFTSNLTTLWRNRTK